MRDADECLDSDRQQWWKTFRGECVVWLVSTFFGIAVGLVLAVVVVVMLSWLGWDGDVAR